MAKGISIHVGINDLGGFYRNTPFKDLKSCINDAEKMEELAVKNNFTPKPVLKNAEKKEFKTLVEDVSKELTSGDICLITFSGHGGQIRDVNRDERFDKKRLDETWCFSDMPMSDDEILELWIEFDGGVRILVVSDSCHSGGIIDPFSLGIDNPLRSLLIKKGFDFESLETRLLYESGFEFAEFDRNNWKRNSEILRELKIEEIVMRNFSEIKKNLSRQRVKTIPRKILERLCFFENGNIFEKDRNTARGNLINKLNVTRLRHVQELKKAAIILLSACEVWQTTKDGKDQNDNGDFTKTLLRVVDSNGNFAGDYNDFRTAINNMLKYMNKSQTPVCFPTGENYDDFLKQNPFTI